MLGAVTGMSSSAGCGMYWESCWIKGTFADVSVVMTFTGVAMAFTGAVMMGCLGGSTTGSTVMFHACVGCVAMVTIPPNSSCTVAKRGIC